MRTSPCSTSLSCTSPTSPILSSSLSCFSPSPPSFSSSLPSHYCLPITTPRVSRLLRPLKGNLASFKRTLQTHPTLLRSSSSSSSTLTFPSTIQPSSSKQLITYARKKKSRCSTLFHTLSTTTTSSTPSPCSSIDWPLPVRHKMLAILDSFKEILKATWSSSPPPPSSSSFSSFSSSCKVIPLKYLAGFQLGLELGQLHQSSPSRKNSTSELSSNSDISDTSIETIHNTNIHEDVPSSSEHIEEEIEQWYQSVPRHLRAPILLQHATSLCASYPYIHTLGLDLLKLCSQHECPQQFLYLTQTLLSSTSITLDLLISIDTLATSLHLLPSFYTLVKHTLSPLSSSSSCLSQVLLTYCQRLQDPLVQLSFALQWIVWDVSWHEFYLTLTPHLTQFPSSHLVTSFFKLFPTSPINFIHFHFLPTLLTLPSNLDITPLLSCLPYSFLKQVISTLQTHQYYAYALELVHLLIEEIDDIKLTEWAIQLEELMEPSKLKSNPYLSPTLTPISQDLLFDELAVHVEPNDELISAVPKKKDTVLRRWDSSLEMDEFVL